MVRLSIPIEPGLLPSDEVVGLALYTAADAEALCDLERDPEHRRRFELPEELVPSVEHSLSLIESWARARAGGERFVFAVRRHAAERVGGELVGGLELWPRTLRSVNLAYWIHPSHRSRGYARRAVALACHWIVRYSALQRIEILTDPDNVASRRVALASGFQQVGVRGGRVLHVLQVERDESGKRG